MKDLAEKLLPTSWKWTRQFIGGHWEQWWIMPPVTAHCWVQVDLCYFDGGRKPGLAYGQPRVCECYPVKLVRKEVK